MTQYFIKLAKKQGSLQRLLENVHEQGADIVELTAKRSLDESIFYVKMSLRDETEPQGLEQMLTSLAEVSQVERETDSGVSTRT